MERRADTAKKKLMDLVNKKFKTTMIGAIASFEEAFGQLWGHGLQDQDLDEDQQYWRGIWEDVRDEILNKGNAQARAAQEELSVHDVTYKGYRTDFLIRTRQGRSSNG